MFEEKLVKADEPAFAGKSLDSQMDVQPPPMELEKPYAGPGRLFSMEGRLNRSKYIARYFGLLCITFFVSFVIGLILGAIMGQDAAPLASFLGMAVGLVATVGIAFQIVKRLHDLDRPGTHYWLLLVPFYNLYLAILLLAKRGTEGPNRYGADPLQASA